MKIVKYKKNSKGRYIVTVDDGREFLLYEDVILKYNLLLKKEIDNDLLKNINKLNDEYEIYYVALSAIKSRVKSIYEMKKYLEKKNYDLELVEKVVLKLIDQKYLDDKLYAKIYINNQIITTSHGPIRIQNDLINKKVDNNIIEEELLVFTEDLQLKKIDKIISKAIKSNRNKGGLVLKQKIINDLKNKGFEYSIINKIIDNYNFSSKDISKKEYDKLYKKYSSKYQGEELKRIIREKMFMKGLSYEE